MSALSTRMEFSSYDYNVGTSEYCAEQESVFLMRRFYTILFLLAPLFVYNIMWLWYGGPC
jgi:hypothetical protein